MMTSKFTWVVGHWIVGECKTVVHGLHWGTICWGIMCWITIAEIQLCNGCHWMCWGTSSQWSDLRTGAMWRRLRVLVTVQARAFWTVCSRFISEESTVEKGMEVEMKSWGCYCADRFVIKREGRGQSLKVCVYTFIWWRRGGPVHRPRHNLKNISLTEQQWLVTIKHKMKCDYSICPWHSIEQSTHG